MFEFQDGASYNTAFTKLAKMNVVGTLRECPKRYLKSPVWVLFCVKFFVGEVTLEWNKSGYLIVKTYEKLYEDYKSKYNLSQHVYGIPRIDVQPETYPQKYRGIDRDALSAFNESDLLAEVRLEELKRDAKDEDNLLLLDGIILSYEDALEVYDYLDEQKSTYEVIWTRIANSTGQVPEGFTSLGFEPSYYFGDHFSALCDCMFIPRWHGTDQDGILFETYYRKLNEFGLFDDAVIAKEFLDFYLSFDWTEIGDYWIIEVFAKI
jgi:hypothetical protein